MYSKIKKLEKAMEKQIENFKNLLEERKILQNQNVMPV